jgi:hypothetical protein
VSVKDQEVLLSYGSIVGGREGGWLSGGRLDGEGGCRNRSDVLMAMGSSYLFNLSVNLGENSINRDNGRLNGRYRWPLEIIQTPGHY